MTDSSTLGLVCLYRYTDFKYIICNISLLVLNENTIHTKSTTSLVILVIFLDDNCILRLYFFSCPSFVAHLDVYKQGKYSRCPISLLTQRFENLSEFFQLSEFSIYQRTDIEEKAFIMPCIS